MDFDIDGVNGIIADLSRLDREVVPRTRVATQKACADTKRDAMAIAPVDTGFLRSSISYETKVKASSVEGEVGPTAEYGVYVELGTSRQAPQAYMGPSFDRNAPNYEAALGQLVDEVLK